MTKLRPDFAFTSKLYSVFREIFKEKWPRNIECTVYAPTPLYAIRVKSNGTEMWNRIILWDVLHVIWFHVPQQNTVRCRYNTVNFVSHRHKIHHSSPVRARYGLNLWSNTLIYILPDSSQFFIWNIALYWTALYRLSNAFQSDWEPKHICGSLTNRCSLVPLFTKKTPS